MLTGLALLLVKRAAHARDKFCTLAELIWFKGEKRRPE
jgi:hypothetical protein